MEAVGPDDVRRVLRSMIRRAERGDVAAARLVLERALGRVPTEGEVQDEWGFDPDYSFL